MRYEQAISLFHRLAESGPVIRRERAEIEDFERDARVAALDLRGSQQRLLHQRAIRDHGEAGTRLDDFCAPERNRVVLARVLRAIVWLPVEPFVLEKHNRIVGTQSGSQE